MMFENYAPAAAGRHAVAAGSIGVSGLHPRLAAFSECFLHQKGAAMSPGCFCWLELPGTQHMQQQHARWVVQVAQRVHSDEVTRSQVLMVGPTRSCQEKQC